MNLTTLTLAARGLNGAWNYFREKDDQQQRNTYDALIHALKHNDADKLPADTYSAARKHAGAITRASHERLDRRRAAFAAAAPDRKARQLASKKRLKKNSDTSGSGIGTIAGVIGGVGALAAGGWALWEFYLRDKLAEDAAAAGAASSSGAEGAEAPATPAPTAGSAGAAGSAVSSAGPLSEEPAERDEALLSSLEEQLSTLDTLADDQRKATD